MKLISTDIIDQASMDPKFAFGRTSDEAPMVFSDNISPHLQWMDFPDETRSFVLVCMDPDVPSVADDVNQPGRVISKDLPRVEFCHWVMVDIPPQITQLTTGECGMGVVPGGKRSPNGPRGTRQGLNDYTHFMKGHPELEGEYFGYDGPCPPWNDERLHHYIFTVYALDTAELDLPMPFDGHQVIQTIQGHVLDQASITGSYTLFKT